MRCWRRLLGAEIRYVASREARAIEMEAAAEQEQRAGRRPYVIPLGASTPLGAAAFAHAVTELLEQIPPPDVIVHSSSSGGTQAGLVAGCALAGVRTRVLGISADEPAPALTADDPEPAGRARRSSSARPTVTPIARLDAAEIDVDDRFVGAGYGVPTPESREAIELAARTEAIFVDQTYTAKAMAGLIARVRSRRFQRCRDSSLLAHRRPGAVSSR